MSDNVLLEPCQPKKEGRPKIILGTMEFGRGLNIEDSIEITKEYISNVSSTSAEIDTAFTYSGGNSERFIGKMISENLISSLQISTKAHPGQEPHKEEILVKYGLSRKGLNIQINESFKRMGLDDNESIDIFYLHFPDYKRDILNTLYEINNLYKLGKFKRFGLSNFASWQVAEIYYLCDKYNFIKPTIYQGLYNALSRDIEQDLIPCLRRFGISFYAYNILCGGILTNKHKFTDQENDKIKFGRYSNKQRQTSVNGYLKRFWRKSTFDCIQLIENSLIQVYGTGSDKVSMLEASLRWIMNHSILGKNDGIIIGCSKFKHFKQNLQLCQRGPLHPKVVETFEKAWEYRKGDAPSYIYNHIDIKYSPRAKL